MLLLWVVTLFNLFYKSYLFFPKPHKKVIVSYLEDSVNTICPLQGFKCPDDQVCDCKQMCVNGENFELFQVLDENDQIFVMNEKLEPGFYCLPKGFENCNGNTSIRMFSLSGWSCLHRNQTLFHSNKFKPCKNSEAENDNLNVLWDYLKNEEAGLTFRDFYEKIGPDLRYRCKCNSRSLNGTKMVSVLPFTCSVDYCLQFMKPETLIPGMGWNGSFCECGIYFNFDPNDKQSACVEEHSRFEKNMFYGKVAQMTEKSFIKEPFIRPSDGEDLMFFVEVRPGYLPLEYIQSKIDDEKTFVPAVYNN